jgi:Na+/melibiose symporter-like transporter
LALLTLGYQERLSQLEPQTEREETLLTHLKAQTDTTIRLILMLFRLLFASMVMTAGVVFLSVGLTQKQFLDIMEKLRRTPEPTSGTPVAAPHGRRDG